MSSNFNVGLLLGEEDSHQMQVYRCDDDLYINKSVTNFGRIELYFID